MKREILFLILVGVQLGTLITQIRLASHFEALFKSGVNFAPDGSITYEVHVPPPPRPARQNLLERNANEP